MCPRVLDYVHLLIEGGDEARQVLVLEEFLKFPGVFIESETMEGVHARLELDAVNSLEILHFPPAFLFDVTTGARQERIG